MGKSFVFPAVFDRKAFPGRRSAFVYRNGRGAIVNFSAPANQRGPPVLVGILGYRRRNVRKNCHGRAGGPRK